MPANTAREHGPYIRVTRANRKKLSLGQACDINTVEWTWCGSEKEVGMGKRYLGIGGVWIDNYVAKLSHHLSSVHSIQAVSSTPYEHIHHTTGKMLLERDVNLCLHFQILCSGVASYVAVGCVPPLDFQQFQF